MKQVQIQADWEGALEYFLVHLPSSKNIQGLKSEMARIFHLPKLPSTIDLLSRLDHEQRKLFLSYLQHKPTRTISGVAPLAVMTKPIDCPHVHRVGGPCSYCPGGPKSFFGDVPQSYTGNEPASMRGKRADYDPYLQAFNRLEQYVAMGYTPQKIEVIIMGGTFPASSRVYQDEFVMYLFKALNDFSSLFFSEASLDVEKFLKFFELPGSVHDKERILKIKEKVLLLKGRSALEEEQKKNESSFLRCVALCIETRPDVGFLASGNQMLRLGCTRVELGLH